MPAIPYRPPFGVESLNDKRNEKARRRGVIQSPDIWKLVGDNSSVVIDDEFLRSAQKIERYDSSIDRDLTPLASIPTKERREDCGLVVLQNRVKVRQHLRRIPLLSTDQLAGNLPVAVDHIRFGDQRSPI